jgi:hypothetical protein
LTTNVKTRCEVVIYTFFGLLIGGKIPLWKFSLGRTADGLKAAEMLAKMCGWNEPERVNVHSVEVKVDAALIAELRAGYATLASAPKHALCDVVDTLPPHTATPPHRHR